MSCDGAEPENANATIVPGQGRPMERVDPARLNPRQKENDNFQKAAAILADYGCNCRRLSDDWKGADFLAVHVDGETTLRMQLKSRVSVNAKYLGDAASRPECKKAGVLRGWVQG